MVLNPLENPDDFDIVTIAGVTNPGRAKITSGGNRPYEWDKKTGKGLRGATTTLTGGPPAEFKIEFLMWEVKHAAEWATFRQLFRYDPTKKSVSAVDIYHPDLAENEITSVVIEDIGRRVINDDGSWTYEVSFLEYFPPPKVSAVSTPNGSKSSDKNATGDPPGSTGDPAVDELNKQIAEQQKKAKALGPL